MIHTYNEYHLGDNLIHLNYLRKVCQQEPSLDFVHYCSPQYHKQLSPLCEGVSILLQDLSIPPGAINAWIGRDNYFHNHPLRRHWAQFHLDWFDHLSNLMELSSPIACKEDLLFDYPALKEPLDIEFDLLMVNSVPQSGQLPDFSHDFFKKRVMELTNEGLKVITTAPTGVAPCTLDSGFTVTDIGRLSQCCQLIEGVDTGPMWTTHNIFNQNKVLSRLIYSNASDSFDLSSNVMVRQNLKN